jgi:hypothetical protein
MIIIGMGNLPFKGQKYRYIYISGAAIVLVEEHSSMSSSASTSQHHQWFTPSDELTLHPSQISSRQGQIKSVRRHSGRILGPASVDVLANVFGVPCRPSTLAYHYIYLYYSIAQNPLS